MAKRSAMLMLKPVAPPSQGLRDNETWAFKGPKNEWIGLPGHRDEELLNNGAQRIVAQVLDRPGARHEIRRDANGTVAIWRTGSGNNGWLPILRRPS